MAARFGVDAHTEPGDSAVGNEDALAVRTNVVVIADGVTPLDRDRPPCRHGVAWYARSLADAVADLAAGDRGRTLPECLRTAIDSIRTAHGSACDLADVDAPAATVAVVRIDPEAAEYLVLGDATIVFASDPDRPWVVTDDRPAGVGRRERAAGARHTARAFRSTWANRPGGYWVAAADPDAADEALAGTWPLRTNEWIVVASDGATRLVDTFGQCDWREAVLLIRDEGAEAWVRRTRRCENADPATCPAPAVRAPAKTHDDATLAILTDL